MKVIKVSQCGLVVRHSVGMTRDLTLQRDRLVTDLEKINRSNRSLSNRHFESPKHPLTIALLQRTVCVVRAELSVRSAAFSARLSSA